MIFKRLKAIYVAIEFLITTSVVIVLMKLFNKHHWKIRRSWAKLQRILLGVKIVVDGKPDERASLVIINHQSMLDIVILEDNYPKNLAWVAKQEIEDIPFWGNILRLPQNITIKREDKSSLVKLFKKGKDRVEKGRVIAIFPEGTRTKGDKIVKFKVGAKLLAEKLNLRVQPVVLVGTRDIFDSQNFAVGSGVVKIIYLDSVNPLDDSNWYQNTKENMSKRLFNELNTLNEAIIPQ
jgi:1-acyl-sn-glycerol-3-phosphate acyltransferase